MPSDKIILRTRIVQQLTFLNRKKNIRRFRTLLHYKNHRLDHDFHKNAIGEKGRQMAYSNENEIEGDEFVCN